MYACAFEKVKTNYELSMDYYKHDRYQRGVIDYILDNKQFFDVKPVYKKEPKVVAKWRIKSKINPLINYIQELYLLNASNEKHFEKLKEQFYWNKRKLTRILNRKRFRQLIKTNLGFRYTEQIIDIISIIAGISLSTKQILKLHKITISGDKKRIAEQISLDAIKDFKKLEPKIKNHHDYEDNLGEIQTLGGEFSNFKNKFLENLSLITPSGYYSKYMITGTYILAEKLKQYDKTHR